MKNRPLEPTHALDKLNPGVRDRIESAALDLFAAREFNAVGLAEVAREARASLQTIYRYYGSKDALLVACLDRGLSRLAERMIDHLRGIQTYKDKLRKFFWVALDFFETNPRFAEFIQNAAQPRTWRTDRTFQQKELTQTLMQVLAEGVDKGILTDAVPPEILMDYLYGLLMRLIQMRIVRGQPLSDRSDVLFEMLWRAIARPDGMDKAGAAAPAERTLSAA